MMQFIYLQDMYLSVITLNPDKNIIKEFPLKKYYNMKLIDLTNEDDRIFLEKELDSFLITLNHI